MVVIRTKVFSISEDFREEEDLIDYITLERGTDCYVDYTANSKEGLAKGGFGNDPVANKLIELGCEEDEKVLIHIDY
tara:strand:+ start:53265 stop:53495 length:231 start_codon:yes stop_codon:yes gene_type:complete